MATNKNSKKEQLIVCLSEVSYSLAYKEFIGSASGFPTFNMQRSFQRAKCKIRQNNENSSF